MICCRYLLLVIYAFFNMNNQGWGTREGPKATTDAGSAKLAVVGSAVSIVVDAVKETAAPALAVMGPVVVDLVVPATAARLMIVASWTVSRDAVLTGAALVATVSSQIVAN